MRKWTKTAGILFLAASAVYSDPVSLADEATLEKSAGGRAKSTHDSTDLKQGRRTQLSSSPASSETTVRAAASGTNGRETQARQIRLQSTLMGANPTALVDGQTVREGDVVASGSGVTRTAFRVLKIEPRRIILEREGVRSEIPLDQ